MKKITEKVLKKNQMNSVVSETAFITPTGSGAINQPQPIRSLWESFLHIQDVLGQSSTV